MRHSRVRSARGEMRDRVHRADESQPARNSCPRLPHSVDSRFGLYHVAVVLSFLRSPALQKFESFIFLAD